MEEKRIIVLINGSEAAFKSGLISGGITVFAEDVARVILEDRGGESGKWITVVNKDDKGTSLVLPRESAVEKYKAIIRFLVSSEKILYVFSE